MRRLYAAAPLLLAACALTPADPFERAERELARSRLLRALEALDTVPISHTRYPDARAAAVDVEGRVRRCHELVLEALQLRSEWRDREALERLRRAEEQWPSAPSLARWISVTEQRIATFAAAAPRLGAGERVEAGEGASAEQDPVASGLAPAELSVSAVLPPPAPAPMLELALSVQQDRSEAVQPPAPQPSPERPRARPTAATPTPSDRVEPVRAAAATKRSEAQIAVELASVEQLLDRGERRRAVEALDALARACPDAETVSRRLATLLQQRALLHYGSGRLDAALADWRRILELQPRNDAIRRLRDRAAGELATRSR